MRILIIFILVVFLFSCKSGKKDPIKTGVDWATRTSEIMADQMQVKGSSYLSVYSDIYDMTDETKHLLTATISMRNTSLTDSLFILKADYFNTNGQLIRSYISEPIFLVPMETVEIVINRRDTTGGSGANFIFNWGLRITNAEPLFESVMIWTTGNQGISFLSKGVKL